MPVSTPVVVLVNVHYYSIVPESYRNRGAHGACALARRVVALPPGRKPGRNLCGADSYRLALQSWGIADVANQPKSKPRPHCHSVAACA